MIRKSLLYMLVLVFISCINNQVKEGDLTNSLTNDTSNKSTFIGDYDRFKRDNRIYQGTLIQDDRVGFPGIPYWEIPIHTFKNDSSRISVGVKPNNTYQWSTLRNTYEFAIQRDSIICIFNNLAKDGFEYKIVVQRVKVSS